MFNRLGDSSASVRYNVLLVLSHLLLNDMLKIKSQVSHIALRLLDNDPKVAELARVFFTELSKKSHHPIFNLSSDLIAVLSRGNENLPKGIAMNKALNDSSYLYTICIDGEAEENNVVPLISPAEFTAITTFLFSFVTSETYCRNILTVFLAFLLFYCTMYRQGDALVERIVFRIIASDSKTQRRNLASCVTLISISEKGVKKALDNFKYFITIELLYTTRKACLMVNEIDY